jgi:hypothetical protein
LIPLLADDSFRRISKRTDYNPETVRRYMNGQSVPADFVAQVCVAYGLDANYLLTGEWKPANESSLRATPLETLLAEIGRRLVNIESAQVGASTLEGMAQLDDREEA